MMKTNTAATALTFEDFTAIYEEHLSKMLEYSIDQVGSGHYAALLAELVDAYPEFEARYDEAH